MLTLKYCDLADRGGVFHLGSSSVRIMHKAWQSCGHDRGQEKD